MDRTWCTTLSHTVHLRLGALLSPYAPCVSQVWSVDTFQGAAEMWTKRWGRNDQSRDLHLLNGHPTIYWQFLANVLHHNVSRSVVPFPADSLTAAQFFSHVCAPGPHMVHYPHTFH